MLDVGSGEGAEAIWLAERGWQVTALDVSTVALRRAASRAAEVGAEVAEAEVASSGNLTRRTSQGTRRRRAEYG